MSYIPNLLPEHSRVDLGITYNSASKIKRPLYWQALSYLGASLCGLLALINIKIRFFEALPLLALSVLFIPAVHEALERKLRFRFTWAFKSVLCGLLVVTTIPVHIAYEGKRKRQETIEKNERQERDKRDEQAKAEAEKREKAKKDSLDFYTAEANKKIQSGKYKDALVFLDRALVFASDNDRNGIIENRANAHFKLAQYKEAIDDYSTLIAAGHHKADNYYQRAVCYQKLKMKAEAVADAKASMDFGNEKGERLYNQLNPIKRRITGYVTRCCDGTTSTSTGRGTCSHHGGVCNWSEPVYEEYREY